MLTPTGVFLTYMNQTIVAAINRIMKVYHEETWTRWATAWINGSDRSIDAAMRAEKEAYGGFDERVPFAESAAMLARATLHLHQMLDNHASILNHINHADRVLNRKHDPILAMNDETGASNWDVPPAHYVGKA